MSVLQVSFRGRFCGPRPSFMPFWQFFLVVPCWPLRPRREGIRLNHRALGTRGRREEQVAELPSLEVRDAAFGDGLDAFLEIVGDAQPVLLDQLVIGSGEHAVGKAGT